MVGGGGVDKSLEGAFVVYQVDFGGRDSDGRYMTSGGIDPVERGFKILDGSVLVFNGG